ncbi:1,4-alpha-glucan branching protein GlgB [Brevibacterium ihuae]|uniref:1,4-alpha-glucan branching protein GlgB n=1 Tax=Brevibacterium ihuae TaxID=1631743 RepID=UPI000C7652B9|nr:1,4-alpha-glucan branching protein GlgB [Brevibacterium ihuae]
MSELTPDLLETIAAGAHFDPHGLLGAHLVDAAEDAGTGPTAPTAPPAPEAPASAAAPVAPASPAAAGSPIPAPSGGAERDSAAPGVASGAQAPPVPSTRPTVGPTSSPHASATRSEILVRTVKHMAHAVSVLVDGERTPAEHVGSGVWEARLPLTEIPDYRLEVDWGAGPVVVDDPYRYLPTVGELDLHLISEGRHEKLWAVLGSQVRSYDVPGGDPLTGTGFAVWAPNARAVQVVGNFNGWDGRGHAMRSLGSTGVWEIFVPELGAGETYKYRILTRDGRWIDKADPLARSAEVPPGTASVIADSAYSFRDSGWIAARDAEVPADRPMSTYEIHLGSWRLGLGYRELARELVDYVSELGFTHVELMPVAEHPFGGSWGYQVTSYYAPASRFGSPDEFRFLVDSLHEAGIGVILDWVPAHFPKDSFALARFDGEPLYEHPDPRRGEHPDWGTLIFDYGRPEVRNFLVANALYWIEEFHIDGLRVDAVASMLYLDYSREDGQWVPNEHGGRENLDAIRFIQEVTATVGKTHPGVAIIAEESTAFPGVTAPTSGGGLGFDLKWNMGWMHDSLGYVGRDPMYRSWHHNDITFSLVYAFSEQYVLPISHDEVVHGKGSLLARFPGDRWKQLAGMRSFFAYQWAHPGKKLVFMGSEFGQEAEWSEQHGLDWWLTDIPGHRGVQRLVRDLNQLYQESPALWEQDGVQAGFQWLNGADSGNSVLSFVRWSASGQPLVCVVNFSGQTLSDYRIPLPFGGVWTERLNTDAETYGGSDVGNMGWIDGESEGFNGFDASAAVTVPALGALYFTPAR